MECVVTPSRAAERETFFGQWDAVNSFSLEHNDGNVLKTGRIRAFYYWKPDFLSSVTVAANESASIAVITRPLLQTIWKNGTLGYSYEYPEGVLDMNTNCVSYIGGDARVNMAFRGTYHAFRLYGRALSADEMAVHAAVDAVRFRGAGPATLVLPAGWVFDARTNLLAAVVATASGDGTVRVGDGVAGATASTNVAQGVSSSFVFEATPLAGNEFVMWTGDTDAISSGAATDRSVTVTTRERLNLTALFRPVGMSIPSVAGRYVTSGLVIHFDGADNAGVGTHSATAATWTDLSGNGNHGTMAPTVTWAGNGWVNNADGRPVLLGSAATATIATKTFTLEFACRTARKSTRECYFGGYNTGGLSIEHNSGSASDGRLRLYYDGAPDLSISAVKQDVDENAVFSLVSGPSQQKLYKNGALVWTGSSSVTASKLANATYYIGGEQSRATMAFHGTYYSFRLYDRLLTDEEVAQNAAADHDRLIGAAAPPGVTTWTNAAGGAWMNASSWDYGIPNVFTPAVVNRGLASGSIDVTQEVPLLKSLTLGATSGAAQVRVADGGTLSLQGARVLIDKGGELRVEQGGTVEYDGSGAANASAETAIAIANGGQMTIDGGIVNVNNLNGRMIVSASASNTGLLSIARGELIVALPASGDHGFAVQGGRMVMTGGHIKVRKPRFHDTWLALVSDFGSLDMSGSSSIYYYQLHAGMSSGTFHMQDSANLTVHTVSNGINGDESQYVRFRLAPYINGRGVMTVDDEAGIDLTGNNSLFYVGGGSAGSVAILNWNSSKQLKANHTFAVGISKGYGELNLTRGQIYGGGFGLRVGQCSGGRPVEPCCVTGVVNMTGGSLMNGNAYNYPDTMHGLVGGAGTLVNLSLPSLGLYRGTINLASGAVTNIAHYTGLGLGAAEGDVVQTGGEFRHLVSTCQMIVGAFGGEGRYVMSNGVASAMSDVFVGGIATNLVYHKPYNLYVNCPVTNHCAKGLLRVAGGSFSTEKTLWVSQDGAGVLEIGPAGTVTAANVAFTNTPAALTGSADLAAKVRFTFGSQGVGTVTTSGALTIGPGATLEVDSSALESHGIFPLISFGSCEGDFASITVTGHGTVVKRATGYVLDRSSGTMVIIR